MRFSELSIYLEKLEKTSSRLAIIKILSELFAKADKNEIDKVVYLSLGILAPNYEGVILNLAEKMMIRVLAQAYGADKSQIKAEYKKTGDLGNVAEKLAISHKSLTPNVTDVYNKLLTIAKDGGEGSVERKVTKMSDLLKSLDPLSSRFVVRIPVGKLRLGFSEKTILDALRQSQAKLSSEEIESAYNIRPDIGYIAKLVKTQKLKAAKPEVGVPVVPELAQRLNSTTEMIKKMGEVSVEPKFDGLRIFIHYKEPNFIKIFTRNMNSIDINTFPELKDVGKYIKADKAILDTEAIGIDEKRERFLDFQKTIQRRRKHDITQNAFNIPLQFQVFDILLVDGKNLIDKPYIERRKILKDKIISGKILRVDENTVTEDPNEIKKMHEKYLKMGLEGVVVKRASSKYVSGRTGWNWVKMKEEEGRQGKLSDTLDLVIMGYTTGKGKRAGFGVGQFLAGVKDKDKFKTVTKVGTGLRDEQFKELNKRLKKITVKDKPKEFDVHKDLTPDSWVEPKIVVELAADEITVSPKHTAGLALRFPRLIRFRDDKTPFEATSLQELKEIAKM